MTKTIRPPPKQNHVIPGQVRMLASPTQTYRLAQLEALVEAMQRTLDVQFTRIAQLQAQLDRAIARQRPSDF